MLLNKVSFIGADFEVGQTRKGLSESSDLFIEYLKTYQHFFGLNFEKKGQVKLEIQSQPVACFSISDLINLNFNKYEELCLLTGDSIKGQKQCLNFGGDHSIALSTIEATLRHYPSTHVIWIDAQADANSVEASVSGNFHGMPVFYLMQQLQQRPLAMSWMQTTLKPEQLTYIGLRDLDAFEIELLAKNNIKYFTVLDIKKSGLQSVLSYLEEKNKSFEQIHLSFDIDSMDPVYGLCTGVPVKDGLSLEDVEKIFSLVNSSGKLINADFVEVNPNMAKSFSELHHIYFTALHLLHILFNEKSLSQQFSKEPHCDFIHD